MTVKIIGLSFTLGIWSYEKIILLNTHPLVVKPLSLLLKSCVIIFCNRHVCLKLSLGIKTCRSYSCAVACLSFQLAFILVSETNFLTLTYLYVYVDHTITGVVNATASVFVPYLHNHYVTAQQRWFVSEAADQLLFGGRTRSCRGNSCSVSALVLINSNPNYQFSQKRLFIRVKHSYILYYMWRSWGMFQICLFSMLNM